MTDAIKDTINNQIVTMPEGMDETVGILQLITGEIENRQFWAYVSMYPSKLLEYTNKVQQHEHVIIEDYGMILRKGWGAVPPAEVQKEMEEKYGADHRFEEHMQDLIAEIEKEQDVQKH
jgi:hypothetical protein